MDNTNKQPEAAKPVESAKEKAVQEALTTYHVCKNGTVVMNPKDCNDNKFLPPMDVSQLSKV